jgi:hypothetical protein
VSIGVHPWFDSFGMLTGGFLSVPGSSGIALAAGAVLGFLLRFHGGSASGD